jgi:hypothetical protein
MDRNLEHKLYEEFDFIHPEKPITENLMSFGFDHGNGWFNLVYDLLKKIDKLEKPKDFEVFQVKEKFGGLRFYVENSTNEIQNLINEAEEESYKICEFCGSKENVKTERVSGWYTTICQNCKKKP